MLKPLEDFSTNNASNMLKDKKISIESLPGYGNSNLKRKILLISMK